MPDGLQPSDQFQGQVLAEGLLMLAKTLATFDPEREIDIIRDEDDAEAGDVAARLWALASVAGDNLLAIQATDGDDPDNLSPGARLMLNSDRIDGAADTYVQAETDAGKGTAQQRRIVAADGASSFWQVFSNGAHVLNADRRLAIGTQSITYPGGSAQSNTATVTHGLGKTPSIVLALGGSSAGDVHAVGYVSGSLNSTTFQLRARSVAGILYGAGSSMTALWAALG